MHLAVLFVVIFRVLKRRSLYEVEQMSLTSIWTNELRSKMLIQVQRFTLIATLALTAVLPIFVRTCIAQQSTPQDTGDVVSTATQDPLTKVIADRLRGRMTAFKKVDAATFGTFLTEDYRSVDVLGLLHGYKPTSQEFAAFPIAQFIASQVLALPIGQEGALVTFTLQLTQPNQGPVKLSVGEVWVKQAGLWKCQYSQSTVTF